MKRKWVMAICDFYFMNNVCGVQCCSVLFKLIFVLTWLLGFSVYLESGCGDKLSFPIKQYVQNLLKVLKFWG